MSDDIERYDQQKKESAAARKTISSMFLDPDLINLPIDEIVDLLGTLDLQRQPIIDLLKSLAAEVDELEAKLVPLNQKYRAIEDVIKHQLLYGNGGKL